MSKAMNLEEKIFSRLTVINRSDNDSHGNTQWLCQCECGEKTKVSGTRLVRGIIRSCGCLRDDTTVKNNTTHGKKGTRIYRIWLNMKNRCNNTKNVRKDYRGRGISICEKWNISFVEFYNWAISNGYDDSKSIDRINNDGNYCPENCRWVERIVQANNNRRNIFICIGDEKKSLAQWVKITGLNYSTIVSKLQHGKDEEVKNIIIGKLKEGLTT
jgi:hypothetical protein